MSPIMQQVKANLRNRRLQTAFIFITLFTAATLFTVGLYSSRSTRGLYEQLFDRTNGAHIWIYLDENLVSPVKITTILDSLPNVEATTGVISSLPVKLTLNGEPIKSHLRPWPSKGRVVAQPLLVAGRAPAPAAKDEIVLDYNVATRYRIAIGDTVEILFPDKLHYSLQVVGLSITSEKCPYPICQPALHYINKEALDVLNFSSYPHTLVVGLRLRDPAQVLSAEEKVKKSFAKNAILYIVNWKQLRDEGDISLSIQGMFLLAFSVVAALASGFLIANVVSAAVYNQTRTIGLLKTVGFTGRQVALVYLAQYSSLALVSGVLGVMAGSVYATIVLKPLTMKFGGGLLSPSVSITMVTLLGTVLVAVLFTLWPVRRAVCLDPIIAIRVGAETPHRRPMRLTRLPVVIALSLSNILARPISTILTGLALTLAVITLTFVVSLNAAIRAFLKDPVGMGMFSDWDIGLIRKEGLSDGQMYKLLAQHPDVEAYLVQTVDQFRFYKEETMYRARFLGGELDKFRFSIIEGRMPRGPDEVAVSYALAQERNIQPGKEITVHFRERRETLNVVGIYRDMTGGGKTITLPFQLADKPLDYYALKLRPGADPHTVAKDLVNSYPKMLKIESITEDELQAPGSPPVVLKKTMFGLAVILSLIAALAVFNNLWARFREEQRMLGLLKAVGMTPREIALCVMVEAMILGLMSYMIGTPLGVVGSHWFFNALSTWRGLGPLTFPTDFINLLLLFPMIVLIAIVGALLPACRAGRTDVVEILRYE